MDQLSILSIKKTKKKTSFVWKPATENQQKNIPETITKLRGLKKDFKFVENGVEKTYKYNGNNYLLFLKSVE